MKIKRICDNPDTAEKEVDSTLPSWLNEVAKRAYALTDQKTAVQVARERDQQSSLFDQLSSVVQRGTKKNFATVQSAVDDLKERVGLNTYLKTLSSEKDLKKKDLISNANERANSKVIIPECLKKYKCLDAILSFASNMIDNIGISSVSAPQLQYDIMQNFGIKYNINAEDIFNREVYDFLQSFINSKDVNTTDDVPINHDFGKNVGIDDAKEVDDPLSMLSPAK